MVNPMELIPPRELGEESGVSPAAPLNRLGCRWLLQVSNSSCRIAPCSSGEALRRGKRLARFGFNNR